ncbi:MAG TPA: transporter [Sutterella sp.]|nr:transporter [Sutterella sp.]
MQTILPYIAIAVVLVTCWGIYKKLNVNIVLLFAGIALNLLAVIGGVDNILPRGGKTTGFIYFDIFEALRTVARNQCFTTGFIIFVAGGFAAYMDKMGASDKLVALCMQPLKKLRNPYLLLGLVFLMGHFFGLVVTSAAGLASLLIVSIYPILIGLGVSSVSAAAVIGSCLLFSYAPSSAIGVITANTSGIDPMTYLIKYQLPIAVPSVLVAFVAHIVVQKYLDAKDAKAGTLIKPDLSQLASKQDRAAKLPAYYAILPLVPLVLLFIFNKMVYKTIVLDVATAMFMGWVFALLVDLATRRDIQTVFADGFAMFRGMGNMLTNVVGLIFVAALFANGLQTTGLLSLLIEGAKHAGLGAAGTGVIMSLVIALVTILTGSGVASFTSLVPLAPAIAQSFGTSPTELAMMLQLASECARPLSPVAGVIIIVAGFAGVSPMAVVRRTWIPCTLCGIVGIAITAFSM